MTKAKRKKFVVCETINVDRAEGDLRTAIETLLQTMSDDGYEPIAFLPNVESSGDYDENGRYCGQDTFKSVIIVGRDIRKRSK